MLELKLVSLREVDQSHKITRVIVPCDGSSVEILKGHAPFIGMLDPGTVEFFDEHGKKHCFVVEKGMVHVLKNQVSILINKAVSAEKINKKDAEKMSEDLKSQAMHNHESGDKSEKMRMRIKFLEEQIKVAQRMNDEPLGE